MKFKSIKNTLNDFIFTFQNIIILFYVLVFTFYILLFEQRKTFIRSAKVFPLVKQTGWKPNPHMYRKVIGSVEVVSGLTLLAIPGEFLDFSNFLINSSPLTDISCLFL